MFRFSSGVLVAFAAILLVAMALPMNKRAGVDIQVTSASHFCSYLPPHPGDNVGATENDGIPFCTTAQGAGTQTFPSGFIRTAHFASTSSYSQVTGRFDRSKYQLSSTDGGGQYDNLDILGNTCNGWKYFVNLIEPDVEIYCIRCCKNKADCNLGASTYGCGRIVPGDYS
ncbi:hypothetical protein BX666DRAFT_1862261 [Dichotomocladium elegans]|nr:hypothetical protein BX666DRAFT_1862261 [Dichotomocladium elegans]